MPTPTIPQTIPFTIGEEEGGPPPPEVVTVEQIQRQQLPKYNYDQIAVPAMVALGIQSKLLIGSGLSTALMLNDRIPPDRYVLTSIAGLGGADIRENRAPRPVAPGEIPYDAYPGGRTLVFEGTMESGSLAKLEQMAADLRASVGTVLEETKLQFNWWDVLDTFSDLVGSKAYWKRLSGTQTFVPGETDLAAATLVYHSLREYFDVLVSARSNPSGVVSVVAKMLSKEHYVRARLNSTTSKCFIELVTPSGVETLYEGPITGSTPLWLQLLVTGNEVGINTQPASASKEPPAFGEGVVINLPGPQVASFGSGTGGFAGLEQSSGTGAVSAWAAQALYPCDFVAKARITTAPQITHAYQKSVDKYRRDFQVTMRASKSYWTAPVPELPVTYTFAEGFAATTTHILHNKGNAPADLVIDLFTGLEAVPSEVRIANRTTGAVFVVKNMQTNRHYQLDSGTRKIDLLVQSKIPPFHTVRSNAFNLFVPGSTWITLLPGENEIAIERVYEEGTIEGNTPETDWVLINQRAGEPPYREAGTAWKVDLAAGAKWERISLSTDNSTLLLLSKFGFAIPTTATVVGVEVELPEGITYLVQPPWATLWFNFKVLLGKVTYGNEYNVGAKTYGGPRDNMLQAGAVLTPAEVNAEEFGVAFVVALTGPNFESVDIKNMKTIRMRIFYLRNTEEIEPVLTQARVAWSSTFL